MPGIFFLTDPKISGLIDWSEAQVRDPAIDFPHLAVFGEKSLKEYQNMKSGASLDNHVSHL